MQSSPLNKKMNSLEMEHEIERENFSTGAPEKIRTPNLLIRSQMLYPIELRAHVQST